jgi:DNA-directed RNA polymerase sigma subunit (sigma70/sigma32)
MRINLDLFRQVLVHVPSSGPRLPTKLLDADFCISRMEVWDRIEDVLAQMTPLQARVLRMHVGFSEVKAMQREMSVQEISRIMGIRTPEEVGVILTEATTLFRQNAQALALLQPIFVH